MEPTAIAASVVALLSPYVAKAGEKAAEEVGKKLPAYAGKMWTAIRDKFKGKPAAEEAVTDLLKDAEDADNQAGLRKELRKVLEGDTDFATTLAELLSQAESEAKSQGDRIANTGSGAVATHGSVAAGQGGIAVQGDVHGGITLGQSKPSD